MTLENMTLKMRSLGKMQVNNSMTKLFHMHCQYYAYNREVYIASMRLLLKFFSTIRTHEEDGTDISLLIIIQDFAPFIIQYYPHPINYHEHNR
jgi:hypothetical protein